MPHGPGRLKELEKGEDLYETLINAASDAGEGLAIVSLDDFRFLWVNRAVCDLFGYREEELLALPSALSLADPTEVKPIEDRGRRQAEGEEGGDFETIGIRRDGSRIQLEVASRRLDAGRSLAIFRDISVRKQTEEALRASEERMRSILETANDAFVAIDEAGMITDWNRQAELTFGWSRDEVIGRKMADTIMPAPYRDQHEQGFKRFLATGEGPILGKRIELNGLGRDGREFPIELAVWAHLSDGAYTFNAFVHEISERKRAEEALKEAFEKERLAAERLREVDQLKDEFISLVSHELRTPLAVIIGLAETLLLYPDRLAENETRDILDRIRRQGDNMNNMVAQLLDLSRLEAGALKLDLRAMNLKPLIRDVSAQLAPILERHEVQVDVPEQITVMADREGFERILGNLLTNAAKYSPPGSPITVSAKGSSEEAVIRVSNLGKGIPRKQQETVFDRFDRGAAATAVPGAGVGLTVARRYVEALGGRIWVESVPGQATTFSFTLPLAEPTSSGSGVSRSKS